MSLQVGGQTFAASQMGPDFLILREPASSPPTTGTVTLEVDGRVRTFSVSLPHGLRPDSRHVEVARLEKPAVLAAA